MRTLFFLAAFVLGTLLIVSSSGNFRAYTSDRTAWVRVVSGEDSYIAYHCTSDPIIVDAGSRKEFVLINLENKMGVPVSAHITADFSNLPSEATKEAESNTKTLEPGETVQFRGRIENTDAGGGPYNIPVTVYAWWDGGDATIEACSINVIFRGGPALEKELTSGETEVPVNTYQEWTFRIKATNPGTARNLTITDTVPGEFDVDLVTPSKGSYTVTQTGGAHHITWNVELNADESAYLDVTVHTKNNPSGRQEFTSCGYYTLNEGAEIVGYNTTSNGITVHAVCGENDCMMDVTNTKVSGPDRIIDGSPGDYHTRISVENTGEAKSVVIKQYVGRQFMLTDYIPSRGTVAVEPVITGGTVVTWKLNLAHGETAGLDLYEHTAGIHVCGHMPRVVLVTGRVYVKNCGCTADPVIAVVAGGCGCHSTATPDAESGYEVSENEDCGVRSGSTCPGTEGGMISDED